MAADDSLDVAQIAESVGDAFLALGQAFVADTVLGPKDTILRVHELVFVEFSRQVLSDQLL